MEPLDAIYENGTLHLSSPLALPNSTPVKVTIDVPKSSQHPAAQAPNESPAGSLDRIYELLEQGAETGISDLAARHNEHQS